MNMVHHGYFNLAGQGSGDVLGQELRLPAPFYTPVDAELLATGEVRSVAGTPFDFREAKPIGRDIGQLPAWPWAASRGAATTTTGAWRAPGCRCARRPSCATPLRAAGCGCPPPSAACRSTPVDT
jgi:hypothetical protein